jgi:GntR family transcriptional regulator
VAGPIHLDEAGGARYRQLAERLRRQIAAGEYGAGSQLPTEAALGCAFDVSRITVRAALDLLVAEGLARREHGRGTFVAAPPIEHDLGQFTDFAEDMAAAGRRPASRVVHLAEEPAAEAVAAQLGVAPGTPVVRVDRLRLADDAPVAFDRTYLPLRYGRLLDPAALATETILRQLEGRYAIPVLAGRYALEATVATGEIAAALALADGAPVLLVHRTSETTGAERVFYQRRHYRGDRVRYTLDLRRGGPGGPAQLVGLASRYVPD